MKIRGNLDGDAHFDEFYMNVMDLVVSSTELKRHKNTEVVFTRTFRNFDAADRFRQRLQSQSAHLNLNGGPCRLYMAGNVLHAKRRIQ
ncbi:unnamed protein product [Vitrella brassicaformis CCMP3155]|uniref:Uncharacterized protein n=1 Tax=Vitrella brassicaformis (strain CCMP3155) TaxID=1169540 RepID=A0A0G4EIL5_VITBC|nr:unnamed protein product [Vitrella brassicaformis CCMP3155]|eukprot:CEL95826.1 unnamed protein product [Vitrella brassicaformis CCMP3155]